MPRHRRRNQNEEAKATSGCSRCLWQRCCGRFLLFCATPQGLFREPLQQGKQVAECLARSSGGVDAARPWMLLICLWVLVYLPRITTSAKTTASKTCFVLSNVPPLVKEGFHTAAREPTSNRFWHCESWHGHAGEMREQACCAWRSSRSLIPARSACLPMPYALLQT